MTIDDITPFVLERLSVYLNRPVTQADLHESHDRLGADSMDLVALSFELEKRTGLRVVPELFLQHDTLDEALRALLDTPAVDTVP